MGMSSRTNSHFLEDLRALNHLMTIPSNEQEQTRALTELKELFREFGEILRSNAKPEDLEKDPDAGV